MLRNQLDDQSSPAGDEAASIAARASRYKRKALTDVEIKEKDQQRLLRNRQSAKESRLRKKEMVASLESEEKTLKADIATLQQLYLHRTMVAQQVMQINVAQLNEVETLKKSCAALEVQLAGLIEVNDQLKTSRVHPAGPASKECSSPTPNTL